MCAPACDAVSDRLVRAAHRVARAQLCAPAAGALLAHVRVGLRSRALPALPTRAGALPRRRAQLHARLPLLLQHHTLRCAFCLHVTHLISVHRFFKLAISNSFLRL